MTNRELQNAFELEANKYDSKEIIESHVIFYWINEAIQRFVKTRYSGTNPKQESFEETQKRTDDLRTLVKEDRLPVVGGVEGTNKPNSFIATIPSDYFISVGEEVQIQIANIAGTQYVISRTTITESDTDSYGRQVADPYSPHVAHYESARPLRLFQDNSVELITDGSYDVNYYYLRYIKIPATVVLDGDTCDLPDHTHNEIVNLAVNLYLENTADQRYQLNKAELNNNE